MNAMAVMRDGVLMPGKEQLLPQDLYRELNCNYPKFFKMDKLCKWAFAGTELLLQGDDLYSAIDKYKIAVVLGTNHGCMDVDKRYLESISVPSPALFVYTLPNIMLGEISIRHGFKGEQLCMVSERFDTEEIYFSAQRLLTDGGTDACLCGWVDAAGEDHQVYLFWVTKQGSGTKFTADALAGLCSI